jgi:hypothetical protein
MTVDEIISNLEDMVNKKIPMSPQWYLEQAQKLVVLMGDETDLLHKSQRQVAFLKVQEIEKGKSVAEAKLRSENSQDYVNMQNQKAKCERIIEIIRIAKIQSRMRNEEYKSNNL